MGEVVHLDSKRHDRASRRVVLQIPGEVAQTGTRPLIALCSDGEYYWCKRLENAHGWESTVNELVVSIAGEIIGAPVRPWKIVEVPKELEGLFIKEGGYRLGSTPLFGSLNVHSAEQSINPGVFSHVRDDSNYNRIPALICLQVLCNAEDIQILYDFSKDNTIWSFDHGFWFGSQEFPWGLGDPTEAVGRPSLPSLRTKIEAHHWDRAINNLGQLNDSLTEILINSCPEEWQVPDQALRTLAEYILERREYATEVLNRLKAKSGRG